MRTEQQRAFYCGAADTIAVLLFVFTLAGFEGKSPAGVVQHTPGLLFGFVLPFAILVGWRGSKLALQFLRGNTQWFRPAKEGFIAGFCIVPVFHGFFMAKEALAAGPAWPDFSDPWSAWIVYLGFVFGVSMIAGVIGALGACLLSGVNRVYFVVYSANL